MYSFHTDTQFQHILCRFRLLKTSKVVIDSRSSRRPLEAAGDSVMANAARGLRLKGKMVPDGEPKGSLRGVLMSTSRHESEKAAR
jgi:hypothetical protein